MLGSARKGGPHPPPGVDHSTDPNVDAKLSAYMKKLLFVRNRAGTSQDLHDRSATELQNVPPGEPAEQLTTIVEGFKYVNYIHWLLLLCIQSPTHERLIKFYCSTSSCPLLFNSMGSEVH